MFDKDINITGEFASILKKYSRKSQASSINSFVLADHDGKPQEITVFDTMVDCYLVSCMLGLINRKKVAKAEIQNPGVEDATIFTGQIVPRRQYFKRVYEHIILAEETENSVEEKIKRAFSVNEDSAKAQELMNEYCRGGLIVLDSYFKNCTTTEEFGHAILKLNKDISSDIV